MAKVVMIGSGGREHALGWKLAQSPRVSKVYVLPGNAGTQEGKCKNVLIDATKPENFQKVVDFVKANEIDLVVVGPEGPLDKGLVDYFHSNKIYDVFGPTKEASIIESDKFYSFDLMDTCRIPQANSLKCTTQEQAIRAIERLATERGVVIKSRGLTEGKGVSVYDSKEQALADLPTHIGKYGIEVLVAERLFGQEFSVFGISDGNQVITFKHSAQDHKPLLDNDEGPNTGGMGAYCPALIAPEKIVLDTQEIMTDVVREMKVQGRPYEGFLYAGMMMTKEGPKVIEFNSRFGDPECQPIMMTMKSDLYIAISNALYGKLNQNDLQFNPGAACCVVLASQGYPNSPQKGFPISGLEEAAQVQGVKVFHAGTKLDNNQIVNSGGRVLGVTAYSPDGIKEAQRRAYEAARKIKIPGGFQYREDIADKALR